MFLEQRISVAVRYGASYADDYAVEITTTSGGAEYRRLVHPYPVRTFKMSFIPDTEGLYTDIMNIYHRAYGKYAGFRAKAVDDYTTNGLVSAPTSMDQTLAMISAGVYQLRKEYGTDQSPLSIGHPARVIYKPVAGTILVSVGGLAAPASMWTADTTTGQVTFVAKSRSVTAITQASSAVVTVGTHQFLAGESVYFSSVSGMTQINGLRGLISAVTASSITVAINSTAFSPYVSGGTVNTAAQASEVVMGGCEFDIPVRFNAAPDIMQTEPNNREVSIELVELLNP